MRASEVKWGDNVWPEPMDVSGLQEANLVTTQSTAVQIHLFSLPLILATENIQMWFGGKRIKRDRHIPLQSETGALQSGDSTS